jgi:hypothetical protein
MMAVARAGVLLATILFLDACSPSDRSLSDSAAGDVSQDSALVGVEYQGVKFPLTSDNFKKFLVAQEALDSISDPPNVPRIDVRNPTDDAIDDAVDELEDHDEAKRAIEGAGISVKDFVLTSLALGQALAFSADPRVPPTNVAFVDSNRVTINRLELRRRFRVVNDDRVRLRGDDDSDDDDRGRRARGHRRGDDDSDRGNRGRGRGRGDRGRG